MNLSERLYTDLGDVVAAYVGSLGDDAKKRFILSGAIPAKHVETAHAAFNTLIAGYKKANVMNKAELDAACTAVGRKAFQFQMQTSMTMVQHVTGAREKISDGWVKIYQGPPSAEAANAARNLGEGFSRFWPIFEAKLKQNFLSVLLVGGALWAITQNAATKTNSEA